VNKLILTDSEKALHRISAYISHSSNLIKHTIYKVLLTNKFNMKNEEKLTPEQSELIHKIVEKELSRLRNKTITIEQLNVVLQRITDSIVLESIKKGLF
jgi:predicted RNA-binding protein YlxR (DUF448 family)